MSVKNFKNLKMALPKGRKSPNCDMNSIPKLPKHCPAKFLSLLQL